MNVGYLPVDRCMVVCRCLCPSTRNCGSSTSFEMPTDCRPEFHLYRISRIVYPTAGKEQEHKNRRSNICTIHIKHLVGFKFFTFGSITVPWCDFWPIKKSFWHRKKFTMFNHAILLSLLSKILGWMNWHFFMSRFKMLSWFRTSTTYNYSGWSNYTRTKKCLILLISRTKHFFFEYNNLITYCKAIDDN